jgi:CRISPR-associated endoribonuclease Cas6
MRFQVTLGHTSPKKFLPIDYQYFIGAWIYKVIGNGDSAFAHFLHHFGYSDGNKTFKLFCYSPLSFSNYILNRDKNLFEIKDEYIKLKVAFHLPDVAEKFIIGLFNNQQAYIGNRNFGLDLKVLQVERMPNETLSEVMHYRLLSPAVFSISDENMKYARYASPDDLDYHTMVINHLNQKLKVAFGNMKYHDGLTVNSFEINKEKEIKSKLMRVKPDKTEETRVRGFRYFFNLNASEEIHRMILNCGFGEKNASGFGWVERIEGD